MASQVVKYTNSNGKTTTASSNAYSSSYRPPTNVGGKAISATGTAVKVANAVSDAYNRTNTQPVTNASVNALTQRAKIKNLQATQGLHATKVVNQPNNGYDGGNNGGGGESYSAPAYSSGSDDVLNLIKSLLEQQQRAAEEAYKAQYEQQLAQNKLAWENNRNQINKNFMRGNRYLQNMYGDAISGTGLSNKARNYQNYQSNLASNQQNYTNNDASALAQFNQNKAGTYSTLANGWYNYVLPIYTNRQQTLDDYNYRRYLASL